MYTGEDKMKEHYTCSKCRNTKFSQTIKEEYDKVYDSIEHTIERGCSMSVGSHWTCLQCKKPIPLKILHNLFHEITYKGYILLDIAEKIKELNKIRMERIGE